MNRNELYCRCAWPSLYTAPNTTKTNLLANILMWVMLINCSDSKINCVIFKFCFSNNFESFFSEFSSWINQFSCTACASSIYTERQIEENRLISTKMYRESFQRIFLYNSLILYHQSEFLHSTFLSLSVTFRYWISLLFLSYVFPMYSLYRIFGRDPVLKLCFSIPENPKL